MEKSSVVRLALLVGALSLAVRLLWALWAHVTPVSDFATYDRLAWELQHGAPLVGTYRTPGYPGFLAGIYWLFGHAPKAAGLVQALLGGVTSGLVVLLAARAVRTRAAVLAGLLHALSPTAIVYTPVLASENLATPLLVLALLLLGLAEERGPGARVGLAAGSGLAFGLLLLTRPAGLFALPAWVALAAYSPKRRQWQVMAGVAAVIACALVVTPWLTHARAAGLRPLRLSSVGGPNLWLGNNPRARSGGDTPGALLEVPEAGRSQEVRDVRYEQAARAWIRANPGRYAALCGRRLFTLLGGEGDTWAAWFLVPTEANDRAVVSYYGAAKADAPPAETAAARARHRRSTLVLTGLRVVLAPFMLLAAGLAARCGRRFALVLGPVASYLAGLSLTFAKARFRELSDPLLFVPLAALLSDLAFGTEELGPRPRRRTRLVVAVLLMGVGVLLQLAHRIRL